MPFYDHDPLSDHNGWRDSATPGWARKNRASPAGDVRWLSNCCAVTAEGWAHTSPDGTVTGRCSKCKEGAVFKPAKQ